MSVFRVITRIIPLNANETSFEPVPFDLLTDGISKKINVLNMTEPQSGVTYRIERIEDIQSVGPGETVESVNRAFSEKLKSIPGFVQLKGDDAQTNLSDKSFQVSLPQVISLNKEASQNENPNSFTISLVKNNVKTLKVSSSPKKSDKKASKKERRSSDITGSFNSEKESKKECRVSDISGSLNDEKESNKKRRASNEIEFSIDKESKKKHKASKDIESSIDKKESKKNKASKEREFSNDKKESKRKGTASNAAESLNNKKESKKKHKASNEAEASSIKKQPKKKHKVSDDTRSSNDKEESKKKHKASEDNTESLKTLHKSKSLSVKKSLKMKYKLGNKIKIFRKSLSPLKTKRDKVINFVDQPCKSPSPCAVISPVIQGDKDSDTEPETAKTLELEIKFPEKCGTLNLNVCETNSNIDKITTAIKDKNVSLDDSSYDMECGDLVINVPEVINSNSNSQQIGNSSNNCDKFNDFVASDSDLSSSTVLKGGSSIIEISVGDDSSQTDSNQMLESSSVDNMSLDNVCSQFVVPVEHPFFDLIQPLKKYFVSGECLICGFIPDEADYNAAEHMETHISSNSSFCFYKCICCTEKFCSPRNLYMHALSREKSYNYMCDICLLKFKRKHYLLRHNAKSHSTPTITNS